MDAAPARFGTKVAVVLRDDLAGWQRANVAAFVVSGIAASAPGLVGPEYRDASGNAYMPMLVQPIEIFIADSAAIRRAYERAMARELKPAVYTAELFGTMNDAENRAAVARVPAEELDLVGLGVRADRKLVDKVVDKLRRHP